MVQSYTFFSMLFLVGACLIIQKDLKAQTTPDQFSGLHLWLASDSGVITSGLQVTSWEDLSGNGFNATQSDPAHQPTLIPNSASFNNLPTIEFSNADFVSFPASDSIRTVFWVLKQNHASSNILMPLLGDPSTYDFHGDNDYIWRNPSTNSNIRNGVTKLNTEQIDGTAQELPDAFSILSLVTTGNVNASNFAKDRGFNNRVWNGELAELIIFNQPLSNTEVGEIETYLANKYAPPVQLPDTLITNNFCDTTINIAQPWFTSYQWSTSESDTTSSYTFSKNGWYSVSVSNVFNVVSVDSIYVKFPTKDIPSEQIICQNDSLSLNISTNQDLYNINWSNGDTASEVILTASGEYFFSITDTFGCDYFSDTLSLSIDSFQTSFDPFATDTSFCSGNSIAAFSQNYEIIHYDWSNGSNDSSIQIIISDVYTITATDINSCTAIDSINVTITGTAPTAGFFTPSNNCINETIQFIDTSTSNDLSNIISWTWTFGDGDQSNDQNIFHSYTDTGTYQVTLTVVTDSGCSNSASLIVPIHEAPQASFTIQNQSPCIGYPIFFENGSSPIHDSIIDFVWDFDYNNDSSSLVSPSYTYENANTYSVQLIAINIYNCSDTTLEILEIDADCGDQYAPLEIGGVHLWLKGDNQFSMEDSIVSIWYDASQNNYHASQSNQSQKPFWMNSDTLINDMPYVEFNNEDFIRFTVSDSIRSVFWVLEEEKTPNDLSPILGDSITYDFHGDEDFLWRANGITSSNIIEGTTRLNSQEIDGLTQNIPDHFSLLSLVTTGNVRASSFAKDRASNQKTWNGKLAELIIFNKELSESEVLQVESYLSNKYMPPIDLPDTIYTSNFCDTTIEVSKPWHLAYLWSTSPADTTASITVNKNGWYTVSVTNIFGKASSDSVFIKFPIIDLNNTGKICLNDSAVLDLSPEITFQSINWNTGETSTSIVAVNPQQYYASIIDTLGCAYYTDTLTLTVDSFEIAIDPLPNDTSFCSGNVIEAYTGNFDINNYEWSNASTDSAINIVTGGIYTVTIENASGCFNYDSIDVTIIGTAPQAQFSVPSFSCSNESVTFQDESFPVDQSNIVEWVWNFNDGDSSNLPNPTHLFDTAGSYQIQLTVITDSGCSKSITKNLAIFTAPMASFTISNNPLCNNTNISFTNTSTPQTGTLSSLTWKLGNTGDSAFTAFVEQQFDAGTHQIILIAENSLSCKDTSSQTIEVHAAPTANFLFQGACANDSIQFMDNSNGLVSIWNWNFNNQATSNLANPKYPFSNPNQDYVVTLNTIDINSCEDDTTILVSPYPYPQASYGTINTICQNSVATLFSSSTVSEGFILNNNWTFNLNGNSYVQNKDTISFNTENNQSISLQLISASNRGCVDTLSTIITVEEKPEALFTISSLYIEENATIDLENQSQETENQYWYFNDSLINTNTTFSYQVADSGTHQIQLIAENTIGCTDTALKNIYVGPLRYDIAITKSDIILNENTNTYSIFAEIQNLTPIPVYDFQISASIYEGSSITEEWSSANPITLQEKILYEFNAKFELNNGNSLPENLCIEISNPNSGIDINALNDVSCIHNSETFQVKNLYPNPMHNTLNVEVLSPTNKTLRIEIYNLYGGKVWSNNFNLSTGINILSADVSDLKSSNYQIVFTTEENRISRYITKINPSE